MIDSSTPELILYASLRHEPSYPFFLSLSFCQSGERVLLDEEDIQVIESSPKGPCGLCPLLLCLLLTALLACALLGNSGASSDDRYPLASLWGCCFGETSSTILVATTCLAIRLYFLPSDWAIENQSYHVPHPDYYIQSGLDLRRFAWEPWALESSFASWEVVGMNTSLPMSQLVPLVFLQNISLLVLQPSPLLPWPPPRGTGPARLPRTPWLPLEPWGLPSGQTWAPSLVSCWVTCKLAWGMFQERDLKDPD